MYIGIGRVPIIILLVILLASGQGPAGKPSLQPGIVSLNLPFVATYQADGLTALGDPTRRAIFESLAERPRAVGELADDLPVSRPAVPQHLKALKDAGL